MRPCFFHNIRFHVCFGMIFISCGCFDNSLISELIGVNDITPAVLKDKLADQRSIIILDIRDRSNYEEGHIAQAFAVDTSELDGFFLNISPPKDNIVVIVCRRGWTSRTAGLIASSHGYKSVFSLYGGMEKWRSSGYRMEHGPGPTLDDAVLAPPRIEITVFEQLMVTITGLGLKPGYMLLSCLLIIFLRREKSKGLILVRRGLAAFLAGEGACALNFLFGGGSSDFLDLFHGAGMVVLGALLPWGAYAVLDQRVMRFHDLDARCVLQRFCGRCWKQEPATCGLQRIFLFVGPALAITALMPLTAPIRPINIIMPVFSSDVPWIRSPLVELFEFRLYPVLAAGLFIYSTILVFKGKKRMQDALWPFFLAGGFASFSVFRFFLLNSYCNSLAWADIWEELTEFLLLIGIVVVLWVFRQQLGLSKTVSRSKR